jgi:hypothetical protein
MGTSEGRGVESGTSIEGTARLTTVAPQCVQTLDPSINSEAHCAQVIAIMLFQELHG